MGRLLDADVLKNIIASEKNDNDEMCRMCIESTKEIIDEQPIAYNPERVVEQLENYLFEKYCVEGDSEIERIVKGGGVNE